MKGSEGRKEQAGVLACLPSARALLLAGALSPMVAAQSGAWSPGFNHERGIPATATATDPTAGFPTVSFLSGTFGTLVLEGAFPSRFNAVHASLIPKGPNQGKVLVWDIQPIIGSPPPGESSPSGLFAFQAYSIVDPNPNASPRFQNFLLPIQAVTNPSPGVFQAGDLFCSGHVWSTFGDLIVVGGTSFIPGVGSGQFAVTKTFAFQPNLPSPFYAGRLGRWFPGPDLQASRYYPTAVLTGGIQRLQGTQCVLVMGGSDTAGGSGPAWNQYEALKVQLAPVPSSSDSGLRTDTFNNGSSTALWQGPAAQGNPTPDLDSFKEYPRCHALTNGRVFMSGFVPISSAVNHETTAWDPFPGHALVSGNWNLLRDDGASIRYPNIGATDNLIVRIGGGDPSNTTSWTTNTVESIDAANSGDSWQPASPLNTGRVFLNAVLLPDASVLVVGGVNQTNATTASFVFQPEIFKAGTPVWQLQPPGFSARDYHATALYLPNGQVFVAGGNNRQTDINGQPGGFDYEVFTPPYFLDANGFPVAGPSISSVSTPQGFDSNDNVSLAAYGAWCTASFGALPLGVAIQRVVLMAPGSTTHHSDMSQRYHQVGFKPVSSTQVRFLTPASSSDLPQGIYMLVLVDNRGTPSDARWLKLQ